MKGDTRSLHHSSHSHCACQTDGMIAQRRGFQVSGFGLRVLAQGHSRKPLVYPSSMHYCSFFLTLGMQIYRSYLLWD